MKITEAVAEKIAKSGEQVESMTEKRYQEIDKAKKSIERLESSIATAMEKNDEESYKKLSDAIGGGNKPEEKTEE